MEEEMNSLKGNNTWVLSKSSKDHKPNGCKWVFQTKKNAQGQVVHHIAKLMAKGYAQRYNVDFSYTFALVVKFTSVRMLLAIVAIRNLEMYQVDFKSAFLNRDLNEIIFMEQPDGQVLKGKEEFVCKL
jgi:hypothetical protein